MAKPISRKEVLKALMPGLNALFGMRTVSYKIIQRKGNYSLKEESYDGAYKLNSKIVASGLTKDEALALRRLTTGED